MVNFEDGELVEGAYVEINGIRYPVIMPEYSGNTPVSAENLNKLQSDLYNNFKNEVLYENESITTFNAQTISNPNIKDYDYFLIFAFRNLSLDNRTIAVMVEKNKPVEINYTDYYNNQARVFSRRIDVELYGFDIANAFINNITQNNTLLIPYKIIGFKYSN